MTQAPLRFGADLLSFVSLRRRIAAVNKSYGSSPLIRDPQICSLLTPSPLQLWKHERSIAPGSIGPEGASSAALCLIGDARRRRRVRLSSSPIGSTARTASGGPAANPSTIALAPGRCVSLTGLVVGPSSLARLPGQDSRPHSRAPSEANGRAVSSGRMCRTNSQTAKSKDQWILGSGVYVALCQVGERSLVTQGWGEPKGQEAKTGWQRHDNSAGPTAGRIEAWKEVLEDAAPDTIGRVFVFATVTVVDRCFCPRRPDRWWYRVASRCLTSG